MSKGTKSNSTLKHPYSGEFFSLIVNYYSILKSEEQEL